MLARYLIIAGSLPRLRDRALKIAAEKKLALVLDVDGLVVLATPDMPTIKIQGGGGVVLGDIFSRDLPYPTITQSDKLSSGGSTATVQVKFLIEECWGHYVSAIIDQATRAITVLRSPFGSLSAYYATADEATIIASDIGLLHDVGVMSGEVDWVRVARHAISPNLRNERACLLGITEVIGGHCIRIALGVPTSHEVWNPWRFTERDRWITSEPQAVEALRQTVDACVAALARRTTHGVLGISGGLDSSIVAAALAQSGTSFSCLTLFTKDAAGDERSFSRILARHLGVELTEAFEAVSNVDVTHSAAGHLPHPIARSFAQSGDRSNLAVAKATRANTLYSGGGGDNVFCNIQSAAPVADQLHIGHLRSALRTTYDVARIAQCGMWTVLRSGLGRAASGRRTYRWRPELSFLMPEIAAETDAACIPIWSEAPRDALPGKSTHVAFLVGILNHIEGYGRELSHETISPLMAQPIVELCLRIPSWMWCLGGQNRSLARRAYADALPPELLSRRAKGTPDCFVVELFEANRKVIRDFLADGLLSSHGILDRDAAANLLKEDEPVRGLSYWRIMMLTDVEAWLQTIRRRFAAS